MSKKLFIVPDGGLANRMRAIASGIELAKQARIEPIIVWHKRKLCNIMPDIIYRPSILHDYLYVPGQGEFAYHYEIPRKSNLFISSIYQRRNFSDALFDDRGLRAYIDKPQSLLEMVNHADKNVLIFSGLDFFRFPIETYRALYQPTTIVENRIEDILRGIDYPILACQVRRTDNIRSIQSSPIESFFKLMDQWVANNPSQYFYLATDDETIKQRFQGRYGKAAIFNHQKASRSSEEGMIDGFAEMIILSRAKTIYGSVWSSYSEAAHLLGDNTLLRVSKAIT